MERTPRIQVEGHRPPEVTQRQGAEQGTSEEMAGKTKRVRKPERPKRKPKKTRYLIDGLIKHAQVCRILILNRVTPLQFYVAARLCQEHLPPSTLHTLHAETSRQKPGQKPIFPKAMRVAVKMLEAKGYLTTRVVKDPGKRVETRVDITQQGWIFYLLLLAEMERPIRELTVYDYPRKTLFKQGKQRPKAGAAMKKVRFPALAKKRGLSIWERSALSCLPQWQRLESGALRSRAPASTPATSAAPSKP